jgi:polyphosphate kinase
MFRGYSILNRTAFRVTRNSNLYMQEEEARSLLESVAEELHNRRKGDAVRMEIDAFASEEIAERLRINFELEPWQVFRTTAPINLSRLMALYSAVKIPALKFIEFHGRRLTLDQSTKPPTNIFSVLRKEDILLHHPFDSYSTVEDFIASAAADDSVISIKQTLYRTSADSTIFSALKTAAQAKDVTVVVELMARFDEASNIRWARELEDAGVQVFHGIFGFKTHCKLALIVRRDSDGIIRSYAHLGTGNYNPVTARFYTDISLLTARPELTDAVLRVFRYLTADWKAGPDAYRPLLVAPVTLHSDILALIAREAAHAKAGRPARIIAKMNGLLDVPTIDALYAASQAGVEIDRPLSRAQPHLLLCERRSGRRRPIRNLLRQRRLDDPQPLRALRSRLPCRRSRPQESPARGDPWLVSRRQSQGPPHEPRRFVPACSKSYPCPQRPTAPHGALPLTG